MRWIPVNDPGTLGAYVDLDKVVKVTLKKDEPEPPTNIDGLRAYLYIASAAGELVCAGEVNMSEVVEKLRDIVEEDLSSQE